MQTKQDNRKTRWIVSLILVAFFSSAVTFGVVNHQKNKIITELAYALQTYVQIYATEMRSAEKDAHLDFFNSDFPDIEDQIGERVVLTEQARKTLRARGLYAGLKYGILDYWLRTPTFERASKVAGDYTTDDFPWEHKYRLLEEAQKRMRQVEDDYWKFFFQSYQSPGFEEPPYKAWEAARDTRMIEILDEAIQKGRE